MHRRSAAKRIHYQAMFGVKVSLLLPRHSNVALLRVDTPVIRLLAAIGSPEEVGMGAWFAALDSQGGWAGRHQEVDNGGR
jgi:hypothetical protein